MTQMLRRTSRPAAVRAVRVRGRRAWLVIVGVPAALFLMAYVAAGGPLLSFWPLAVLGGLAVVFSAVSVLVRLLMRREVNR